MIEQLSLIAEPNWLSRIDPTTIQEKVFPLDGILRDSLYYPSSGFDGDPVRHLVGNFVSFIYVDYGRGREDFESALISPGFRGYDLVAKREVAQQELAPRGWRPSFLTSADGDPSRHREQIRKPFCLWVVLQRRNDVPACHGPYRFSLLYLCADGVAAFQALYVANNMLPAAVAVIQPGHGFGGNWTNFEDPAQIFARTVTQNPAGVPDLLLYGGYGRRDYYRRPCWPGYEKLVCFLEKSGGGSIGVWQAAYLERSLTP
ncbi:MAG: hypothetical protein FJ209_02930 [Betaproteobacteria bacterium]|nr:hypothetical protein [Betaproteobacteria bacterium]